MRVLSLSEGIAPAFAKDSSRYAGMGTHGGVPLREMC